ncbi:type III pantothenate kinase [Salisediminibacterium beveridgei]|uniref:Type III pantothenate kinase n=1 Tax=Salisediminibacterium beveridgei TaxID=632773 RepID=A0A1D7R029_9BACI|nr:type III pantothenate kinase [Salisediminibacterium beveridgei]AOM84608.1 Pantothenate kinase type III, CoaX-like [Salisediminibacterium beveridgei]
MLLAMDIGNTTISTGLYRDQKRVFEWVIQTDYDKTVDEYGVLLGQLFMMNGQLIDEVTDVMVSSVVPPLDDPIRRMFIRYFKVDPVFVGPGVKTGLNILADNPREVGSDRISNAVGALAVYEAPFIIVDFGTATTFCYVNESRQYAGGVIAPGMGIAMEALYDKASKLPKIDLAGTETVIGRNTTEAMRSGYLYGYVGQVEGIVGRINHEIGTSATVIATGEHAELLADYSRVIDHVHPHLTLDGLHVLHSKQQQ